MNDRDLQRLETALEMQLPEEYKRLMVDYPIGCERGSSTGLLNDDVETLIQANLSMRKPREGEGVKNPRAAWPNHLLLIGADEYRALLIDVSEEAPHVVYGAPRDDAEKKHAEADSLEQLVNRHIANLEAQGVKVDVAPPPKASAAPVIGQALLYLGIVVGVVLLAVGMGYMLAS